MKANPLPRLIAPAIAILALAGCSAQVIPPPPSAPAPAPTQAPRPAPPPPPPPANWQDAPATPGDWNWSMEGGRSTARFAGGLLAFACDRASGRVQLTRQGLAGTPAGTDVPLTISTTSVTRSVTGSQIRGPSPSIVVNFAARDSLLDAMAFSRGRFAVQAPGLPALYVPSWPEIGRVIEDCR